MCVQTSVLPPIGRNNKLMPLATEMADWERHPLPNTG